MSSNVFQYLIFSVYRGAPFAGLTSLAALDNYRARQKFIIPKRGDKPIYFCAEPGRRSAKPIAAIPHRKSINLSTHQLSRYMLFKLYDVCKIIEELAANWKHKNGVFFNGSRCRKQFVKYTD